MVVLDVSSHSRDPRGGAVCVWGGRGDGTRELIDQQPGLQASAAFSVQHRFSRATREPATRSAPATGGVHTSGRSRRAGARWTGDLVGLGGRRDSSSDYHGTALRITD